MGFPRQEYLSGLPSPSPGDLPDSGTKPTSLAFFISCITTSAVFKLYVSLFDHTLSKIPSFEDIMNSWPFTDTSRPDEIYL